MPWRSLGYKPFVLRLVNQMSTVLHPGWQQGQTQRPYYLKAGMSLGGWSPHGKIRRKRAQQFDRAITDTQIPAFSCIGTGIYHGSASACVADIRRRSRGTRPGLRKRGRPVEFFRSNGALHIVAKEPAFGIAVKQVDVPAAKTLRLHWGVSDYPEGVSYQHGVDNEAIMVYVFFGHKRLPSGEIFVPDSPYFIGFYLCPPDSDVTEQPYKGHHYEKTGRYICVD